MIGEGGGERDSSGHCAAGYRKWAGVSTNLGAALRS